MPKLTKAQEAERQDAIASLKEDLRRGGTVYYSRATPKSARIYAFVVGRYNIGDSEPICLHLTNDVRTVLGLRRAPSNPDAVLTGYGTYDITCRLSRVLFGTDNALTHRWL